MNLSPHFTLEELIASATAQKEGIDNTPSQGEIENLTRVAEILEEVRELLGDKPIGVSSGYRCIKLNRAIGSNDNSAHVTGCAADVKIKNMKLYDAAKKIVESKIQFDQLILEPTWIHIGIAPIGGKYRRQVLTTKTGKAPYLQGLVK